MPNDQGKRPAHWSLGIRHWALIGHWCLVIGHSRYGYLLPRPRDEVLELDADDALLQPLRVHLQLVHRAGAHGARLEGAVGAEAAVVAGAVEAAAVAGDVDEAAGVGAQRVVGDDVARRAARGGPRDVDGAERH